MIDYNLELIFGTLKFFAVKKIRQTDKWQQQRQTVVIVAVIIEGIDTGSKICNFSCIVCLNTNWIVVY